MNDSSILVSVKNKVQIVQLNRPKKKNAFSISMYTDLTNILNEAAIDDNIIVTVLTGSGDYYSSGNDIMSFLQASPAPTDDSPFKQAKYRIQSFVEAFINFPKILIAVLNGPAIGIAATTLALCDVVYASETVITLIIIINCTMSLVQIWKIINFVIVTLGFFPNSFHQVGPES